MKVICDLWFQPFHEIIQQQKKNLINTGITLYIIIMHDFHLLNNFEYDMSAGLEV